MNVFQFVFLFGIVSAFVHFFAPSPLKVVLNKIFDTLVGENGYFTQAIEDWTIGSVYTIILLIYLRVYYWMLFT